ncbi:alpha/beta hydrolase [Streptomyces sp. JHD 1]|nr:alpha/beta hydrolase [Streptomyces sp. JHD 1]
MYYEAGQGPAVVLLHGNATSPRDWWRIMEDLRGTQRVIAPALPGFGYTSPLDSLEPERLASFIAAFLDEVKVDKAVLVGHSTGGALALAFTLAHPDRVTRLALADSAGLGRSVNPLLIAEALVPLPLAKAAIAVLLLPGFDVGRVAAGAVQLRQPWRVPWYVWATQIRLSHSPTFLLQSFRTVREGVGLLGQRHVYKDRLREIRVPTLVIWGLTDLLFPVRHAVSSARRLPSGSLAIIPTTGHGSYLECHEEFIDALGPFVRDDLREVRAKDSGDAKGAKGSHG